MKERKRQQGFSLFEMVIAIAIIGVLSFVTYGVIALNANTYNMVHANTTLRWDMRKAMQLIQADVQMMDVSTIQSMNGAGKTSNQLRFSTMDGDNIRYQWQGTKLRRRVNGGAWLELTDALEKKPFRYLDVDLNPTNNQNNVAFVQVNLNRTVHGQNFTLTERFYVRN